MADDWAEHARELAARRVERRQFLRGALGVSGLAILNGMGLARAALPRRQAGGLPLPRESGIDTIVVTMLENRSFDHFFGWIPGADGVQAGFSNPSRLDYDRGLANPCPPEDGFAAAPGATEVATHHLHGHCNAPDPDHGWFGSRVELNRGAVNGFADRSGDVAMGYYTREDIPFLGWMGAEFTTFDRYFCSVLGPTFPNRLYWLSGEGGTAKGNALPTPSGSNPVPTGYTWPTIFDRLSDALVPWAYYATDVPTIELFFRHNYEDPGRIRHIADYFADAAAGVLPPVVFLDPGFFTIGNDYHPAHDILLSERYVQDAFLALAEGPQWARSVFVLTFDEHGGFYDHVPPPVLPDVRLDADHCENWGQAGFRVPTVIASPLARRKFVGHDLYDHASILRFIEWRFGLQALTPRDAGANNIGDVLDFTSQPNLDLPDAMPFIPIHEAGIACAQNDVYEPLHDEFGDNPLEPVPDLPVPPPTLPEVPPERAHREIEELADAGFFGRHDFRDRARSGAFRN